MLRVDGPGAGRDVSRAELAALASGSGGEGAVVAFPAVEALVGRDSAVTHATFHASDGYAASIPIEQARRDGSVVVPPEEAHRTGVRLVVAEGHSTCLNVKAVVRVELSAGPGRHTVDPNPHTPAHVGGWDD